MRSLLGALALLAGFTIALAPGQAAQSSGKPSPAAIVVPSQAGKVDGRPGNSDRYMWEVFTSAVRPAVTPGKAVFETWATDEDIYQANPVWPTAGAERPIRASRRQTNFHLAGSDLPPCGTPENPWVANFPLTGCLAEVVYRDRLQFDYIVGNGLNTKAGAAAFYASPRVVNFPGASLALKADWVPLTDLLQWVPELGSLENARRAYYTVVSEGVEYGLVAMHISTAANPAWVWGTFEHRNNPGRCDATGCYDSFGARRPVVLPDEKQSNTQYGACTKTPELKRLMQAAGLSGVWENYCLKSTQVSFTNAAGKPTVLTNSVTERLSVNGELIGSCISCHAYAAFGADGAPTSAALTMLAYNPVGKPIASPFADAKPNDFMWGIINFLNSN
ncbi:hypothetical protein [Aestuariivirga litoralis]|nr:hypothetical protein [Aestuariivirga litoralis]